jgi:hypothetical protein
MLPDSPKKGIRLHEEGIPLNVLVKTPPMRTQNAIKILN